MSDNSAIEWTDATWNPVRARNLKTGKVGWHCEHATTGCLFCYAEGFNKRLGTGLAFKPGHRKDIEIFLDETMLTQPLRWKKPRKIFVGSMTDLFADFVTDEMLNRIFAAMTLAPQHTYQVLTKRAARMRDYCSATYHAAGRWNAAVDIDCTVHLAETHPCYQMLKSGKPLPWPLPNVWLGVSTERQQEADERIPELLRTPAAVRFISAEPLLGPIDLMMLKSGDKVYDAVQGCIGTSIGEGEYDGAMPCNKIDLAIVGGESGPKARPMHPAWATSLNVQCEEAGVKFFFKQWGAWAPFGRATINGHETIWMTADGNRWPSPSRADKHDCQSATRMSRIGKSSAGRLLDGIEHNAMPDTGRGT